MGEKVKFSSKMDPAVLEAIRAYAAQSDKTVASVLTEAAEQYLARLRVRPAFLEAADAVMEEHAELLSRLAR